VDVGELVQSGQALSPRSHWLCGSSALDSDWSALWL